LGRYRFRLLPPLLPAYRARRVLALTLRDLRRVAIGSSPEAWESHVHGRLSAMPDEATPLQRAQLLAALSVGSEIIRLRDGARRLDPDLREDRHFGARLEAALIAVAQGNSAIATASLARLDEVLAAHPAGAATARTTLRMRASILALSETLNDHAPYLDGAAR
jgi:hypothetical protein